MHYITFNDENSQDVITKSRLPIDLIVLDLLLSDMDGIEVCHYLKQAEVTRNVPVIILSDRHCAVDEKVQCFQLGADDFLCKPFENEELFARIFALLRRHYGEDDQAGAQRVRYVQELREIIDQELIEPNFQPVYLVGSTCELFGVEILSRPLINGALKNPELLFEVALELGFYYELETMVWRKALDILKEKAPCQNIFLNCSPYLIENDNFSKIESLFKYSGEDLNLNYSSLLKDKTLVLNLLIFSAELKELVDSIEDKEKRKSFTENTFIEPIQNTSLYQAYGKTHQCDFLTDFRFRREFCCLRIIAFHHIP